MGLISTIKGWWNMIIGRASIEQALKIKVVRNPELESAQQLWQQMLQGKAEWNTTDVPSLQLANSICREISNNTIFELEAKLTGNKILTEQFADAIEQMSEVVSALSGNGSIVLKPFIRGDKILLIIVTPDRFFPVKYNEIGNLVSVAFADSMNTAEDYYTLLELHTWDEAISTYAVEYQAFHSKTNSDIGKPVPIESIPVWAHLQNIQWENITQPLFVEINMPDKQAIFAKAVDLIRLADEQYGRAVWEYEGSELAIDASVDLFRPTGNSMRDRTKEVTLPKGKARLYRINDADPANFTMQVFSPAIRDANLFNGLNEHKRAIEFACGIAYATISDPNLQDKTATEIRATKQRFLVTVRTIQNIVEKAYSHLAESMNVLGQLYGLFSAAAYDTSFTWGDSIMEDPDIEYQRRKEMVGMGLLSPVAFLAWYFNIDEKEAEKMIPEQATSSLE